MKSNLLRFRLCELWGQQTQLRENLVSSVVDWLDEGNFRFSGHFV